MSLVSECAGVRVAAIGAAVPKSSRAVAGETQYFEEGDLRKIVENTGVVRRRVASPSMCASDLCFSAATAVLEATGWARDSIDAVIFVSQTPDYVLPATACTLQARLGLSNAVAAFDVNQGCSGYVYGLWIAAGLLQGGGIKRCVLLVGDTISRVVSPADRGTALLFGDGGSATLLERASGETKMIFRLGTDGCGADKLIIPAGGYRRPLDANLISCRTAPRTEPSCEADLHMDGGEIFTFALTRIPPLIDETLSAAGWAVADVDFFIFHQANAFMLRHLCKKMRLPKEKVPIALEEFGNTSSASIPITLVSTLGLRPGGRSNVVLAGFGVGFSWAACALKTEGMQIVPLVEVGE
jgi:3-oxoacyl-[acyl-carrier-protein] synthase-3